MTILDLLEYELPEDIGDEVIYLFTPPQMSEITTYITDPNYLLYQDHVLQTKCKLRDAYIMQKRFYLIASGQLQVDKKLFSKTAYTHCFITPTSPFSESYFYGNTYDYIRAFKNYLTRVDFEKEAYLNTFSKEDIKKQFDEFDAFSDNSKLKAKSHTLFDYARFNKNELLATSLMELNIPPNKFVKRYTFKPQFKVKPIPEYSYCRFDSPDSEKFSYQIIDQFNNLLFISADIFYNLAVQADYVEPYVDEEDVEVTVDYLDIHAINLKAINPNNLQNQIFPIPLKLYYSYIYGRLMFATPMHDFPLPRKIFTKHLDNPVVNYNISLEALDHLPKRPRKSKDLFTEIKIQTERLPTSFSQYLAFLQHTDVSYLQEMLDYWENLKPKDAFGLFKRIYQTIFVDLVNKMEMDPYSPITAFNNCYMRVLKARLSSPEGHTLSKPPFNLNQAKVLLNSISTIQIAEAMGLYGSVHPSTFRNPYKHFSLEDLKLLDQLICQSALEQMLPQREAFDQEQLDNFFKNLYKSNDINQEQILFQTPEQITSLQNLKKEVTVHKLEDVLQKG